MPRFPLPATQLRDLAAFVRSLGRSSAPVSVEGDVRRGAEVYAAQGCPRCHTVRGKGGALGPDLTGIGSRTGPAYLRQALTDPAAQMRSEFATVRLVIANGDTITGIIINEDSFAVQLRDSADRYRSFWKSELKSMERVKGRSLMPSYESLSAADLRDVIAYLVSLDRAE